MGYPTRFRCALSGGIIYEGDQLYTTLYKDSTSYNEIRIAGGLQTAEAVDEYGIGLTGKKLNLYKRCGIGRPEDDYISIRDVFGTVYNLSPDKNSLYGKAQLAIVKKSAVDIIFEKEMSKYNVFINEIYEAFCKAWLERFQKEVDSEFDRRYLLSRSFALDLGIKTNFGYRLDRYDILRAIQWHFGIATEIFHLHSSDLIDSYPPKPPSKEELQRIVLAELVRDHFSRIAIFHNYAYLNNKGARTNSEIARKLRLTIKALNNG